MSTVVTKEWLDQHKTVKGGWNAVQLHALGLKWPPTKGWAKFVIGRQLTQEQVVKFEKGKVVRPRNKKQQSVNRNQQVLHSITQKNPSGYFS